MAFRPKLALRIGLSAFVAAAALFAGRSDATAVAPEAEALAWRLDGISGSLLGPTQPNGAWRRSDALLQAAARLNPSEPRFPRLRVLIMQHLGDTDGAIAALRAYRTIVPQDRLAQAQLIDLYATKLETLDAKLAYLKSLLDKAEIAPEVRAHIAERCTQLLLQVSNQDAAEMAKRAVELFPLAEATRQNYELSGRAKAPEEQAAMLLQLLKANPNQPAYLTELGRLLAGFNLLDSALQCYDVAIGVILNSGPSRPADFHDVLVDYASLQVIVGHADAADGVLAQMLQQRPLDSDAWFLKLSMTKAGAAPDPQLIAFARSALIQRWNAVHDEVLGIAPTTKPADSAAPPTTQPVQVEPDEVASVVKKLGEAPDAMKKNAVVAALSDLAWFEIYFASQADAGQKWIDQLSTVSPEDPAIIARLTGWKQLRANQNDTARETFAKVADQDALSKFGMLQADVAEKKPLDEAAASKLLADHRLGVTAAILWQSLRNDKTIPATQPAADGVRDELRKFPRFWLSMIDHRATRHVYDLRVEPLAPTVLFGDPMLVRVTLQNQSDQDITIGPGSLVRPDLWFDGQTLGLDRQIFPGVAYDQITGELVLHPNASVSQVVRIDLGGIRKLLDNSPATMTRIGAECLTNPVLTSAGATPAPGGLSTTISRGISYVGLAIVAQPADKKRLDAMVASQKAVDRIHAADELAGYVNVIARSQTEENVKKLGADLGRTLDTLKADASPAVSAWVMYLAAAQQATLVEQMAKSPDATTRLLSLFAGPTASQQATAKTLAGDADPLVKQAAQATLELSDQPTTAPAESTGGTPFTRPTTQ